MGNSFAGPRLLASMLCIGVMNGVVALVLGLGSFRGCHSQCSIMANVVLDGCR
jgi:hypothetical protein